MTAETGLLSECLRGWQPETVFLSRRVDPWPAAGPLLALLALELPRVHSPDRRVRTFGYRLVRPALAPCRIVGVGQRAEGAIRATVAVDGAAPSLTAEISLEPPASSRIRLPAELARAEERHDRREHSARR